MREQLFGPTTSRLDSQLVNLSKEHLANNGLLGKKTNIQDPINVSLPKLQGRSLDEHFFKLGAEMSQPYLQNGLDFIRKGIPDRPDSSVWVLHSGWTKYVEGQPPEKVEKPDSDCLVFDVEVLYEISDFPVMAVAVSTEAWYGWVSPWLSGESESDRHLIPLVSKDHKALVIGHNVGYDRKRVEEEYHVEQSNSFYLDTMSLHVAVNGMCSQQRPAWMQMNKKRKTDSNDDMTLIDPAAEGTSEFMQDLQENPWFQRSSLNNLADCAAFHCNIEVDKSRRDYFKELDCAGVREKFNDLMDYCASDVDVTFRIFGKVFPSFLKVCPHPVSFAALRHLSAVFLPINENWQKFVETSEQCYRTTESEIYNRLRSLAETYVQWKNSPEMYENDPWLSQLDWTIRPVRYVKSKNGEPYRLAKNQKLPGMPNWYRDLFPTAASKTMNLSVRSRIAPRLLRLQWDGRPLVWSDTYGYVFKVTRNEEDQYLKLNYAKCDMNLDKDPSFRDDANAVYFKIPHKDGHNARCTNPMAKSYISYFEKGTLSSEYEYAKDVIKMNAECTYWIAARERIFSQMPVYQDDVDMGMKGKDKNKLGMIIPRLIPMGTITRRAVEDSWLTASNAKKNRIGSELKAMIQAPPGYIFVGADVDSEELWIASLLGDSLFGIHGGSALGWMTLEGTKNEGTDLHSKTANILGISRNEAKIFNYGRIYGAGLNFAIQLLKQFNPLITDQNAKETATRLYEATKGVKTKSKAFKTPQFWRGGSESVVFNRLEELAEQEIPCTPVLGAAITEALMKQNLRKSNFLTSRVNWSIQSSGVDYLHLLIVSMNFLIRTYGIRARLSLTVHDEIRYLVKEEDKYKAALALQISNLWTRAMFCQQLGIENVPQSCAFFSLIDIDRVLRKEVDIDCVTPSNPTSIPPGEAIDMVSLLKIIPKLSKARGRAEDIDYSGIKYKPREASAKADPSDPTFVPYLRAQVVTELEQLKQVERSVNPRLRRRLPQVDSGAVGQVTSMKQDVRELEKQGIDDFSEYYRQLRTRWNKSEVRRRPASRRL